MGVLIDRADLCIAVFRCAFVFLGFEGHLPALSRREVKEQVSEMQTDIRLLARDRHVSWSEMLPSVRELALRYGISYSLVAQSLKTLAEEGIIHSVPRVGSFLGRPQSTEAGVYSFLGLMPRRLRRKTAL